MKASCEVCGSYYDKSFEVIIGGEKHVFDCFECAIHLLAPPCDDCGCRILGHGIERSDRMYCSNHCASRAAA